MTKYSFVPSLLKDIRSNLDFYKRGLQLKGVDLDLDELMKKDQKRIDLLKQVENQRSELNRFSKERKVEEARRVKRNLKKNEEELSETEDELAKLAVLVPNPPEEGVPVGGEKNNEIVREEGKRRKFDFRPQDYLKISEKLDLIDTERAAKVSGTRFGYIKGGLVFLEFALIRLAMEELSGEGFVPVLPPVLIKEESMRGMGYLERGKEEIYHLLEDDLYLVGTAEQSIGPMHMKETFEEKDLPKRYIAFSTSFRREAGSYGKDTKGILRVHQFDKVEMFSFVSSDKSREEHQFLLSLQERLMKKMKIPYRVVRLAAGDLAYPSAATYDIESWMPGQNQYRETHSTSNTTDFQARRLNIRYKPGGFVHTLNGTAFAIGRMLIAIIENYQNEDGSVTIPEVLKPFVNFELIR